MLKTILKHFGYVSTGLILFSLFALVMMYSSKLGLEYIINGIFVLLTSYILGYIVVDIFKMMRK